MFESTKAFGLTDVFHSQPGKAERIGIELEYGLVRPSSGESVSYGGPAGARSLLANLLAEDNAEPVMEEDNLLAVRFPDGAEVSLEPGGAVEYSGAPVESVAEVISAAHAGVEKLADLGRELGIAVLPGGVLPFTTDNEINWIPKQRIDIMRGYFDTLGDSGSYADSIMGLTTSTQATLDYLTEDDLGAKLRMLVGVSPIAAALFVNSPIEAGKVVGALSRRLQFWRKIAPLRTGVLKFAIGRNPTVDDVVEWVSSQPMIYRLANGHHVRAPGESFAALLDAGFGDGELVTRQDWESQLNQVWPHVRVRGTLELRIADGLPWPYFGSVPAFWVGLAYDAESLRDATDLVKKWTWHELEAVTDEVAEKGLAAKIGDASVREIADELLRLSRRGLTARIAVGKESAEALDALGPLSEMIDSGCTFADLCIDEWLNVLDQDPARYVERYRV